MKIINNIQIMELGSEYVAVPVGNTSENHRGVFQLNETGKFIWDLIALGLDVTEITKK